VVKRRSILASMGAFIGGLLVPTVGATAKQAPGSTAFRRVRPSDPAWPDAASWETLNQKIGGRLIKVKPLLDCPSATNAECTAELEALRNPYYVGDQPAGTQTAGWVDGWMSAPSAYAVPATTTADVVAAVNFARENNLRLVVKGGGHSYQGTSDSADSLLVWTRPMNDIVLHDAFVGQGCEGKQAPSPAVTVGAGCVWMHVYDAVTTKGGRYVQGGGCATVGVAGLIQSGGFGSFSKNYGSAAAGLLEAEIVTADGQVRIANACTNPDLFWGLKGGGGGCLGVVTRVTLRTRDLPDIFGNVNVAIKAASDAAFRRLISRFVSFCDDSLANAHWGETVSLGADNTLTVTMVFQGMDEARAAAVWHPFMDWIAASSGDFKITKPLSVRGLPARDKWSAAILRTETGHAFFDSRPGAAENNIWFAEENTELGVYIHGYQSLWLPASLLRDQRRSQFALALFNATRHWAVGLHFNKGLSGASAADIAAARDTAMNPAVLDAFALAIIAYGEPDSYTILAGHRPDVTAAQKNATAIMKSARELRKVAPDAGSYLSESDFFDHDWRHSFHGPHYPRLLAVKKKYDPEGLFFVHHGVGSEEWSSDGFTRLQIPT
jgi:FAD/FMN-containing dehydrogenase